ncbi:MAG: EscU/YscU/HrcU family type III secretion system export apparatus switch protein [Deltaproteobacteria bacterium]|jgi:flagellar biosynthesis protein FlhB
MADDSQNGERTEEATPRKREQARKEGQVANSSEVGIAMTMLLLSGLISWVFPRICYDAVSLIRTTLSFDGGNLGGFEGVAIRSLRDGGISIFRLVAPVAFLAMLFGIIANVAQVGFNLNFENLAFKWERLDPSGWFKRMTGVELPVTLAKSFFKGMGLVFIALLALQDEPQRLFKIALAPIGSIGDELGRLAYMVVIRVAAAMAVVAGLDVLWTRYRHEEKLKMTKDEVKREQKESFGDPHIRAARRRRMNEIKQKSLDKAVQDATVVSVNPTHYAVALRFRPGQDAVPVVVAKGVDFKALRIRELAEKYDVPVQRNVPLTRALYAAAKEGDEIPFELFEGVAQLLKLVRRLRGEAPYR